MQTSHLAPLNSSPLSSSAILSSMDQGAIFIDRDGFIKELNANALEILNLSDDGFKRSYSEFLATTDLTKDIENFSKQPKTQRSFFKILKTADGNEKYLTISLTKVDQGLLILLRDLTEVRELKIRAGRSDRLKDLGAMAALLAHEIRNPLGGIKGFASLLYRDLADQPALQQMVQFVIDGTENLTRLVTHILNYAHPFQTEYQTIEFLSFLKEFLTTLKADTSLKSNVAIATHCDTEEIFAEVDPQLLRSALLNLSLNAIQAMPNGGLLSFDIAIENEMLRLKVSDTGIGIRPDNLKKLFQAFFTTKPDGNGFGLLEVNKVIQAHGGTIDVTSEIGKGTLFTIRIPIKGLKHVY